MKRAIFRRGVLAYYAVMSERGAVVAAVFSGSPCSGRIMVHWQAADADDEDSHADCEFVFGYRCMVEAWVSRQDNGPSGSPMQREREAITNLIAGDWRSLVMMFVDIFVPVEER